MKWHDQPLTRGMWLATCVVIGLLLCVFVVLWTSATVDSHDAKTAAARQADGRRIAVDVLCGGVSGVEDAGTQALNGTLQGLHGRGVPSTATRDYVSTISSAVIRQAGVDARKVLRADGRIDCDKLRVAAAAVHP
jgi:hypothetical protein